MTDRDLTREEIDAVLAEIDRAFGSVSPPPAPTPVVPPIAVDRLAQLRRRRICTLSDNELDEYERLVADQRKGEKR